MKGGGWHHVVVPQKDRKGILRAQVLVQTTEGTFELEF